MLAARSSEYVTSARLLGSSAWRTMWVELRPNIAGPIFVLAALDIGNAVLLLSGLSFLGLGAQPPTAEWGSMVSEGAQNFSSYWIGLFPGLAILTVVLAFNFVGDALRDMLDPRTARMIRKVSTDGPPRRPGSRCSRSRTSRWPCARPTGSAGPSTASRSRSARGDPRDRRGERLGQDPHGPVAARPAPASVPGRRGACASRDGSCSG